MIELREALSGIQEAAVDAGWPAPTEATSGAASSCRSSGSTCHEVCDMRCLAEHRVPLQRSGVGER